MPCLSVCLSIKSHLTSAASVRPENSAMYSVGNEGQKICDVFSETVSFQSYGTSCIVWLPCSQPFSLGGICVCASKMPLSPWGGVWSIEDVLKFCKFCNFQASDVHSAMLRFIRDCHQLSLRFSSSFSILVSYMYVLSLHMISP